MSRNTITIEIARFLNLLVQPGDVFEVRAPKCLERRGATYTSTVSGYFMHDSIETAAGLIAELDESALAPGVYVTLNPVRPDLLARAANRLKRRAPETSADGDILARRWLLIDVDPIRPSGVSATDEELELARQRASAIYVFLSTLGWPEPIVAMSGNGYHLLYHIDLPVDDCDLVRRVLAAIADHFDDARITIDRSVHNPARITKIIGTMARKGDDLPAGEGITARPHRRSKLFNVPDEVRVVPVEALEALVESAKPPPPASPPDQIERFPATPEGVRVWLEQRGVPVKGVRRNGTKTMLLLERCPINPEIVSTSSSDIAVLVGDDGRLAYCNRHNRGENFTWPDLRRVLDPEYAARGETRNDIDLSGIMNTRSGAERATASGEMNEPPPGALGVDATETADTPPTPPPPDPGLLPTELLRVPGFVGEVMDFCLDTAPYPNLVLAFCGALALQAFLAGRKVRDGGDNRTNMYLLGLAHSSAGKDWPRKVNTRILHEIGLSECLGERFASGEGIQDALFKQPGMLFQTDEIDGMLQSINKARDARHEAIMSTLLTMYSSSNSVYPMRRKAGKEAPGVIDQPGLVIFGTAIPNHYYEALSERMLTNGFFARMLILEAGQRGAGQEPSIRDLPTRVIETARWWSEFMPGKGNLEHWHPVPRVVPHTDAAKRLLIEMRAEAEAEYAKAEEAQDAVGTTVWGRVSEQVRKLALLHAISANAREPSIDADAVRWARQLVMHQTRRMLYMAAGHVAENPFHAECLKLMKKLREAPDRMMARNKLMRAMHAKLADFDQIIATLLMQEDIECVDIPTRTKPAQGYRLP